MVNADSSSSSDGNSKVLPQQIENLSPLAIGDQKLNRHLGYFSGTLMNGITIKFSVYSYCIYLFCIVGQIIGTGIFSNPTFILINCGSGGMMLILWIVGAIFAGAGVWNYLELGTMLPRR
jgi:amino acid transporter